MKKRTKPGRTDDVVKNIITVLRNATKGMVEPACMTIVKEYGRNPFLILVSCILSLRTKDTVSLPASRRLFALCKTPLQLLAISQQKIAQTIFPVGFYKRKAQQLHKLCKQLINNFGGKVPSTEKELMSLVGVGLKTTNLVLGEGFDIPAICVDVHVHRISNRLGLIATKTPEETEKELKKILPKNIWIEYNRLLVMWGQNICTPTSPWCSKCPLFDVCEKINVLKSR